MQADVDTNIPEDANAFYGVTSRFESRDNITIQCSTKVCSFGQQVVEKVEVTFSYVYLNVFSLHCMRLFDRLDTAHLKTAGLFFVLIVLRCVNT